jgi:hypothetical protein
MIFKVVLKGNEQEENSSTDSITLTFKSILTSNIIRIPSHYISTLKSMSEEDKNIVNFQNIEEVIIIGDRSKDFSINYYLVLLFSIESNKRNGYLIANIKKVGDALVGIWPFNEETENLNEDYVNQKFNDFINNRKKYKNLVIINPS